MNEEYLLHSLLVLWSLALGGFLCAVYDIFRLFRLERKPNAVLVFFEDLVYCVFSALCILILFFNLSYGRMRGYAFIFILLGFLLWRFTVSRLVMPLMQKLIMLLKKLLNSLKMRFLAFLKRRLRRLYTRHYCKKTVSRTKCGDFVKQFKGKEL